MTALNDFKRYVRDNNWPACAGLCAQSYENLGTYEAVAKEFRISKPTARRYILISRCFPDLKAMYGPYKLSIRHGMALSMLINNRPAYSDMKQHMEACGLSGLQALEYAKSLKGQEARPLRTTTLIRKYMNGQINIKVYASNLSQKEEQRLLDRLFLYIEKIDEMAVAVQEDIENKGTP